MKGYVPTPPPMVDRMVDRLFHRSQIVPENTVLDPGCAEGAFIEGILRWCDARNLSPPNIVGVELNPRHVQEARAKFADRSTVRIELADFLGWDSPRFDFIVGNPPYVPITELSEAEKARYRMSFDTAKGRFDLYILFFEKALRTLNPEGRLVFVTPEKYLYVETAAPLRELLTTFQVEEIDFVPEDTFGELVTYPAITSVANRSGRAETIVTLRDGTTRKVRLPLNGRSWQPVIRRGRDGTSHSTLQDVCLRVSCGVATGADSVFVLRSETIDPGLRPFAQPTIAGRELTPKVDAPRATFSMLTPYATDGRLLDQSELGALEDYLSDPSRRSRLLARTCVRRKPWYAFHENPPLSDLLRPKILCKDITSHPQFWIDREGTIVPRHSVYYIVPRNPGQLDDLASYLNSDRARAWLRAHCQRAANGFLRLQSQVLKRLPVPRALAESAKVEVQGREALAVALLGATR